MVCKKLGEPFLLKGGENGILFAHGFTGSPGELKSMAHYLNGEGYTCLGIRLKGHCTDPYDLSRFSYMDWIQDITEGYKELRSQCRKVFICGISMGANLALFLGENYRVDGLVCMSTPVYVYMSKALPACRILKWVKRFIDITPGGVIEERFSPGYKMIPLVSIESLHRIIRNTKKDIGKVSCPILIMQSSSDTIVKPESARFIYDNVSSKDKSILWLKGSGHNLVEGKDKNMVFSNSLSFFKKLSQS